jgi:hypothetical protein
LLSATATSGKRKSTPHPASGQPNLGLAFLPSDAERELFLTPHPGPLSERDWPLDHGGDMFSRCAYCKLSCKLIENVSAAHWIIKEIGVACLRLKE